MNENICPVCGEAAVGNCKCPLMDSQCPNGHWWHKCLVHHKTVLGHADHSLGTFACHCHDFEEVKSEQAK